MHGIYELKEHLCEELEEYGNKEKLDVGALEIVDKLAHTVKNLDKIIDHYEDSDYSGRYYDDMPVDRHPYSMARRGIVKRDSMGRYARDNKMMVDELKKLMNEAPDERSQMEIKKLVQKLGSM